MTELALLPDIAKLLVNFLLDQDEVAAFFTDRAPHDRVYTTLPDEKVFPAVRVTRYGGVPRIQRPLHLDQPTVQIDAFGGGEKLAHDLAATCRAVMAVRIVAAHDEGVVTAVDFGGFGYAPDDTFNPAKPRYLFRATLTTHPRPATGS